MSETERNNDPENIFYLRSNLPPIVTSNIFKITSEKGKLRVKNKNVNCLFSNLSSEGFDKIYNAYYKHLNLDFETLVLDNQSYSLPETEQNKLVERIITSWIYYYSINNLYIEINPADFTHPDMVDNVLRIVDEIYGVDTKISLALGAKILRRNLGDYTNTVMGRRLYYDR